MLNRSNLVLAMVLASAAVAAPATYLVLTNAWDARLALSQRMVIDAAERAAAAAETAGYPQPIASGSRVLGYAWPEPDLPEPPNYHRAMPEVVALLRPPRTPGDRRADPDGFAFAPPGPDWRPVARPERLVARAAQIRAQRDSGAVFVSLRPLLRPDTLDFGAASVAVARAALPEDDLSLARLDPTLSDVPGITPRFEPRVSGPNPCTRQREMPRRARNAASGSAVLAAIGNGSGSGRDRAVLAELLGGNMPAHLRELRPVRFSGMVGGRQTDIVICVTPDYLAVGSDADHVRVPLGLPAAFEVADAFDMILPTTRMVDAIYAQADLRLSPRPMTPGPQMSSTDYFARHDATLDAQIQRAGGQVGALIAGHKKDVVLSNRLSRAQGRIAIYGWHRGNGNPIQPLSTVHGASYADYSHGIRLVSRTAYVDGRPVDLRSLLTDGRYAGLLNADGPLNATTVRLAAL